MHVLYYNARAKGYHVARADVGLFFECYELQFLALCPTSVAVASVGALDFGNAKSALAAHIHATSHVTMDIEFSASPSQEQLTAQVRHIWRGCAHHMVHELSHTVLHLQCPSFHDMRVSDCGRGREQVVFICRWTEISEDNVVNALRGRLHWRYVGLSRSVSNGLRV